MTVPITVEDLTMEHPVYTLRLTAAQRSTLDWLTCKGALYAPRPVDSEGAQEIADDCGISVSTVYEALNRLTNLRLLRREGIQYQVNPRFFFAQHPEVAQLALHALQAPDVVPDERAHQPRRMSPADARRRRVVRSVG
ncbi:helix-turn-helix domain-containing protein [Streptomyces diastaticus]|uniref:helix-turn-helix domain-containing protein n=1 Tax=Streptomyces TaxID=1883 RepID=UPI000C256895|nr:MULTISPECIES: helix-turn-helix domain-containing protein [unclassified Streptomyces]MBL3806605.1 helix-turn-helix domain-containing protein [Streptomyces sp. BRB081]NEE25428.1 helix-turn-helix domain-containing protein [Streptomyces sp. SID7982]PJM80539.1 hypothetical protein CH313_27955 [Streptomyces sp. TSRI0384-2]RPK79442.1 hypothetical protein EES47_29470 [Streptomyces sp. ADI98-12]